jgi:hypothetical protein
MLRSLTYLAFNSIRIIRTIAHTRDALATSPSAGTSPRASDSSFPERTPAAQEDRRWRTRL